ncbi:MAG: heme-binding protein [Gammaproteobacteria bacterium]|nr:heme-binding protein [Gammaproteobacteria bacterium]
MIARGVFRGSLVAIIALAGMSAAFAQTATFQVRLLTPEAAVDAARGALEHCRKQGFQVAVAVVDRAGTLQVLLRDRFAGAHTIEAATDKAWTAASFRMASAAIGDETQAGRPMSGLRALSHLMPVGGGQPIESGGSVVGAIGVSGAPGGDADDVCAKAGVRAIADSLEF